MKENSSNYIKYTNTNPLKKYLIRKFIDKFLKVADVQPGQRICDIGCGEGFIIGEILKKEPSVHIEGYDVSEPAVKTARERLPEVTFEQLNIYDASKLKQNRYDKVLAMEILEHLDHYRDALKELAQLDFKELIISVPHEPYFSLGNMLIGKNVGRLGKDPEHVNFWNEKTFTPVLKDYFNIVHVEKPFPWMIFKCVNK